MGIIRRQSIWSTILTYIGALLGFVTIVLLFPKVFSTLQIGLISILVAYATVFATFASLGVHQVVSRFFPYFKNKEKQHNGFLFLIVMVPIVGYLIFLVIYPLVQNFLIERSIDSTDLLNEYLVYVIPMVFMILFFTLFDNYYKFLRNILLGTFLKEVLQRLIILFAILLFYFSFISFKEFINIYLIAFTVPLIVIVLSLIYRKEFALKPQLGFVSNKLGKIMMKMGVYGIISSFTGIVIINVDKIMIERFMGLENTGIYTIAFFFGMLIALPSRPLLKISSAYIAEAWRNKDVKLIDTIYRKSSINQFVIGLLVFLGIWCNVHNIFKILPSEYSQGKWVIFFIGISYVFEMITNMSAYILINSKLYKFVTYIMLLLIVITVILNFVFIPIWGITGAAVASMISKISANLLFAWILYTKQKLSPINKKHIVILGIGIIAFLSNLFLPILENYIIDIIYRSLIITFIYGILIYVLKVSDDINDLVKHIIKIK